MRLDTDEAGSGPPPAGPRLAVSRRTFLLGAAGAGVTGAALLAGAGTYESWQNQSPSLPWESEQSMQSNASNARQRRIVFLHQSTGADIIKDGNLRALLRQQAPALELWDYAFNPTSLKYTIASYLGLRYRMPDHFYGLHDGAGRRVSGSFQVPGDNTSPEALAGIFAQPVTQPAANTLSNLLRFDVIAFKSCFTIFPLTSDEQLARYQQAYVSIRRTLDQHPDKLFLPLTPPPLRASLSTPEQAARARRFARWIMSPEFHGGQAHIQPFDLFDALAVPEGAPDANTLRPEFCRADVNDSHPNPEANTIIAGQWAGWLARTVGQTATAGQPATAR